MKILALECSAVPSSVAILEDDKLLAEFYCNIGLTHSQTLMPMVESVLNSTSLTVDDIDGLCISAGPGSFTGVRIGISTLKGLAAPQNKQCVGVSTLEAMAYGFIDYNGIVAAIMDARCNQCYCALFLCENQIITRITEDLALSMSELCDRIKEAQEKFKLPAIAVGDGAALFIGNFQNELQNTTLASSGNRYQSARFVAVAAKEHFLKGNTITHSELQPIYLRLPQAERELKKKLEEKK